MKKQKTTVKTVELALEDRLSYICRTDMYGRAQFHICPKFLRGRLTDLFIYRRQQPHEETQGYHMNIKQLLPKWKIDMFQITAWTHKTAPPYIWRNFWCKEHKTIAFDVYVPDRTNMIEFGFHLGDTMSIRFVQKGAEG